MDVITIIAKQQALQIESGAVYFGVDLQLSQKATEKAARKLHQIFVAMFPGRDVDLLIV